MAVVSIDTSSTEQPALASSLRSTPILIRVRIRPDEHTTATSSSSSNSTQEYVLVRTKSKTKQAARIKKRGHPSKNELNDDVHSY